MEYNRKRKRAIAKAERELDRLENFKEHVRAVGGSYRGKNKNGNHYGVMHVE